MRPTDGDHSAANSTKTGLRASQTGPTRWVVWVLLCILIFALATDVLFYTGFFGSDDLQYTRAARELAQSRRLTSLTLGAVRLALILPLAFVARVTGENMFLMAAFFAVYHLLVVVGTYWLGSLIHDRHTGVLAAGFMAVCPLAAVFATTIMPDHPVTGFSLLSAGCLLAGRERLIGNSPQTRLTSVLFGLSGFLFGVACAAKVVAIILVPVFLLVIASCLRRAPGRAVVRAALLFALGFGLVALIFWTMFYMATGLHSPLQDADIAARLGSAGERIGAKPYNAPGDRLQRLISFGTSEAYLGLLTWAVLLAIIGYPLVRRRSWGLYLTFVWVCAYMTWGSFSLTRYMPPPMNIRYFIFALPPMMVMSAYVVMTVARPVWSRAAGRARHALVGLGAILCMVVVADSYLHLNRRAGRACFAREVNATRYALDFARSKGGSAVVLSSWLSGRVGPSISAELAQVVLTDRNTKPEDIASAVREGRFFYVHAERELAYRRASKWVSSPLDEAIQNPLGEGETGLQVHALGTFKQFASRLAGLRYLYGGSGSPDGLDRGRRGVILSEVTLVREELPEDEGVAFDLSQQEAWGSTQVHRVEKCDFTLHGDRSLECDVVGSEDASAGQYGGVRMQVGGMRAIQVEANLRRPEQTDSVFVDLTAGPGPRGRLRWHSTPEYVASLTEGVRTLAFALDRPSKGASRRPRLEVRASRAPGRPAG